MTETGELYKKDWWQIEAFKRFEAIIHKSIDTKKIDRILDLGCGNGVVTQYLSSIFQNATILGVDSNEEMISYAQKNNNNPNVIYKHMDIRNLENIYGDKKFDLVNANYVLHWLSKDEKQKLFQDLQDITAPKSHIMIGTCQRFPNFLKFIDENIRKYFNISRQTPECVHYFSEKEWNNFLNQNNFLFKSCCKNLDIHPILLSEKIDDQNNFLRIWLWGASAGKAAYFHHPRVFNQHFIDELVNKSYQLYGTESYYKNDFKSDEIQNYKYAVFEEETLFIVAQKC